MEWYKLFGALTLVGFFLALLEIQRQIKNRDSQCSRARSNWQVVAFLEWPLFLLGVMFFFVFARHEKEEFVFLFLFSMVLATWILFFVMFTYMDSEKYGTLRDGSIFLGLFSALGVLLNTSQLIFFLLHTY